uniref:Uncharacterized protein n=1 Tax=Aegilops tauschii TaxID=37682 RepID=R7W8U5_AEGTA
MSTISRTLWFGEVHSMENTIEGDHASAIVAVDTNLDTSTPDTYRAPPAPLPYDVSLPVTENPDLEKSDIKSKTDDQQESLKVDEYESCEKGIK